MKVKILKTFDGAEDGIHPRVYEADTVDEIEGDLLQIALDEGWAEPHEPEADGGDMPTILEALDMLDPLNDDHWTEAGKPAMAAIEAIMGTEDVTRKDVDEVAGEFDREKALEKKAQTEAPENKAIDGAPENK